MFVTNFLVFLLHVATFIAILSLSGVVLVVLGEVPPGLEVVPVLIKLVNLLDW